MSKSSILLKNMENNLNIFHEFYFTFKNRGQSMINIEFYFKNQDQISD